MMESRAKSIENLEDAASYLEGLINVERDPTIPYRRLGLEPIQTLLDRVGRPQDGLSIIHVAGSKGKGSTCLLAETLLAALGERVGTFTSPHLISWTERFRIAGEDVAGQELAAVVDRLRPHVEALRADPVTAPSFFDATTAAALLLFAESGVDRVLLEVGLGGRLDSTNVVSPEVTCITSIELEHTDRLGDTHAAIAAEKAGIIKAGIPCVVGQLGEEAAEVVMDRAAEMAAPIRWIGRDFDVACESETGSSSLGATVRYDDHDGGGFGFDLAVAGPHQVRNAGLAIESVRALGTASAAELAAAAGRAFACVSLPGRLEVVGRRPWRVVDSAHTADSTRELAHFLSGLGARRLHLVLSVSADKRIEDVLAPLLRIADSVVTTCVEPRRSASAEALAKEVSRIAPGCTVDVEPDPARAFVRAVERAGAEDAVCAAGSIYLAGAARVAFGLTGSAGA